MDLVEAIQALQAGKEIEGLRLAQDGEVLLTNTSGIKLDGWKEVKNKRELSWDEIATSFGDNLTLVLVDGSAYCGKIDYENIKKELGFK